MITHFSSDDLKSFFRPVVYQVKMADGTVVYVGASNFGAGRPLSCTHKVFTLVTKYNLNVSLDFTYFDTANEAFAEGQRLIRTLRPKFNWMPISDMEYTLKRRED